MKNTGMTRPIDPLGRVVIPKEIRNEMGLDTGVRVEIWTDGGDLIFRRHNAFCACCGKTSDHMLALGSVHLCQDCYSRFREEAAAE